RPGRRRPRRPARNPRRHRRYRRRSTPAGPRPPPRPLPADAPYRFSWSCPLNIRVETLAVAAQMIAQTHESTASALGSSQHRATRSWDLRVPQARPRPQWGSVSGRPRPLKHANHEQESDMPSTRGRTTLARRRTAAAVGAALLLSLPALLPGTAAAAAPAGQAPDVGLRPLAPVAAGDYVTRPDIAAEAPELTTTTTGDTAPGLLMTTIGRLGGTYAAAIHRDDGDLVWWRGADDGGNYMDLEPVTFHGEPALAVFHGLYGAEDPG